MLATLRARSPTQIVQLCQARAHRRCIRRPITRALTAWVRVRGCQSARQHPQLVPIAQSRSLAVAETSRCATLYRLLRCASHVAHARVKCRWRK